MSLIKDPHLKTAIQNILGPDVLITLNSLQTISVLDASHQEIKSLDGIEYCHHLEILCLDSNLITDLSPLRNLTTDDLTELQLNDNQLSDLSPLAGLSFPRLTDFGLGHNRIENLNPLKQIHFGNLKAISLHNNKIKDLSPLQSISFPNLSIIFLHSNEITDFSPIIKNTSFQSLALILTGNPIRNLKDLTLNGEHITELYLDNTGIQDLSPLNNISLKNLHVLNLNYNNIMDLTPISKEKMPNLTCLELDENGITDLQPLSNLPLIHESIGNQHVTLPKIELRGTTLTINNPITNKQGQSIPPSPTTHYTYDAPKNTITWQNLIPSSGTVSFKWEDGTFDGEAIQPYEGNHLTMDKNS